MALCDVACVSGAAAKMEASDQQMASSGRAARFAGAMDKKAGAGEAQLVKVCRDAAKFAVEQVKGLSCQARRYPRPHVGFRVPWGSGGAPVCQAACEELWLGTHALFAHQKP